MRLLACVLAAGLVTAALADDPKPKPNPFRDGTGQATPEKVEPAKPAPAANTAPVRQGPRVVRAAELGVGRLAPNAEFTDLAGKPGTLSDFKASKLLVVAFTETGCPVCKKYAPALARLEKEYAARGVAFLFVNPNAADAPAGHGFAGRYVHDKSGTLTAALGAKTTTEVVVLDPARTVVYRGAVDDQYGLGYSLDAPRNAYLKAALDDLLAGKPPVTAATTAPGCELGVKPAAAPRPTYHARVERIVQQNCVECHRAGGLASFPLETYEQVVAKKAAIKRVVDDRTMPPWFATPPAKGEHSPWVNDRSLTEDDKDDLLAWLSGDAAKGDMADAPLPRTYASGWLIGKPDVVFQIPRPISVKAEGTMPYQMVSVPSELDEDRWVQALEVQPTAREVVHHVLVFAMPKGQRRAVETQGFFAAYVPGNNTLVYPDGLAKKLPKGSDIVFQIHYTPNGKATTDQTRFAMVFAKEAPRQEVKVAGIANTLFQIPAGADNHKVEARIPVPFNARALAFFPHAHLRGKAARYDAKFPDGTTRNLLEVPRYDFNWQLMYRYADPVAVPRGSTITYTAWYDNSAKNPANPDPTKRIGWGPQTYDEMHLGYLEYVID
jgi:thiol-disulfide isomerase/thioredoxin/mono/diheme cytochrome c family protein